MQSVFKIFIAGSKELVHQRDVVRSEISKINVLASHENICFAPFSFEDFNNAQTNEGQQSSYDTFIENEADIMILLVKGKIGEISKAEYNRAYSNFIEKGHPALYVFSEFDASADLTGLNSFFRDYYSDYESEDGLRLLVHKALKMYIAEVHKADSKYVPIQRNSIMNFHKLKVCYVDEMVKRVKATNNYIDLEGDFIDNYTVISNNDFVDLGDEFLDDEFFASDSDNDEGIAGDVKEKYETVKLSTILDSCQRLVLLGNPGTGKTTILTKIFKDRCLAFIAGEEQRVPVYVRLSLLSRNISLQHEILRAFKADWIKDQLNDNIILLLDGLNEISVSEYRYVVSEIEMFLQKYPDLPVVITSRKHGFNNIGSLPVFEINPLTREDISKHIESEVGRIDVCRQIMRTKSLCELATNPMNLSLILKTWETSKSIPDNRGELYNCYVDLMFKRENQKRKGDVSPGFKKYILSKIAFEMKNAGNISAKGKIVLSIIDDLRSELCLFVDKISILDELLREGLLIKDLGDLDGEYAISFVHETYLEFFAACYLTASYKNEGCLYKEIFEPEWSEVLKISLDLIFQSIPDEEKVSLIDMVRTNVLTEAHLGSVCYFYEIMSPVMQRCNVAKAYMEQFMFYLLNKIKNGDILKECNDCKDLFVAISILSSSVIYNIIFFDEFWRRKWTGDASVRDTFANSAANVFLLYNKVEMINDSNICLPKEDRKSFEILENNLLYRLSDDELAYLYNKTKYLPYLYLSNDVNFIDKRKDVFIEGLNGDMLCCKYMIHNMINRAYFDYVFSEVYAYLRSDLQLWILAKAFEWFPASQVLYDKLLNIRDDHSKIEVFTKNLKSKFYLETPPLLYAWFKQLKVPVVKDCERAMASKTKENLGLILSQAPGYMCRSEIIGYDGFIDVIDSLEQKDRIIKKYFLYEYFPCLISKSMKIYIRSRGNKRLFYSEKGGRFAPDRKLLKLSILEEKRFIFIRGKSCFGAIDNTPEIKSQCGFLKGVVSTRKEKFCHIYVKEKEYDYFAHFSECYDPVEVGDLVSFFPTVNKMEGKPMAVAVELVGSCRRDGIIVARRISKFDSSKYVYTIRENIAPFSEKYAFDKRYFDVDECCIFITGIYNSNDRAKILETLSAKS